MDYGEWKTGKNARGFIMSLISFPIKVAVFARSAIITAILASAGYVANMAPTPKLVNGIKAGITVIPAAIMLVGLLFIIFLYSITPKRLEEMQKEIASRKAVGTTA